MNTKSKRILTTVVGCVLIVALALGINGRLRGCSTGFVIGKGLVGNYDEENYDFSKFTKLIVEVNMGDLEIVKGDVNRVEAYYEKDFGTFTAEQKNDTLTVKYITPRVIGHSNHGSKTHIKIYVTEDLDKLDVVNKMDDAKITDINAKDISIEINMGDLKSKNLNGDLANIHLNMGDIKIDGGRLDDLTLECNMGNVDVVKTAFNKMYAHANMGDIDILLVDSTEEYSYSLEGNMGDISVNNTKYKKSYNTSGKSKTIKAECNMGDITIK